MIKPGTDNLIKWLDLNKIDTWDLSTTRDKTQNAMIFKSDPEQPREREQQRMVEQLALSENAVILKNLTEEQRVVMENNSRTLYYAQYSKNVLLDKLEQLFKSNSNIE